MERRIDYLSDNLVHVRAEIKARQKEYLESRGRSVQTPPGENSGDAEPVETSAADASPAAAAPEKRAALSPEKKQALARRYEQTLQLRRDLEQRMIRCEARLRNRLTEQERLFGNLSAWQQALEERRTALRELALPEAESVSMVELGELYRAIDRERLNFFQVEAECDAALPTAGTESSEPGRRMLSAPRFGQAFKLGLAFTLPLILGLGLAVLAGAVLIFLSFR